MNEIKIDVATILAATGWKNISENGVMTYQKTKADFSKMQRISINRQNNNCSMEWSETELSSNTKKDLISFNIENGKVKSASPELKTKEDFDVLFKQIEHVIKLMNKAPDFLFTGSAKSDEGPNLSNTSKLK